MASSSPLWWTTPLQCVAIAASATMFGGSGLLSPVVQPMLENRDIPVVYQSKQTVQFLYNAEMVFPPTNALATLSNLALTIAAYRRRNELLGDGALLGQRFESLGAALAFSVATTVYTLSIMVPKNNKLKDLAAKIQKDPDNTRLQSEFRDTQVTWKNWAYGRALLMLGGAVAGLYSLTLDARAVKL